MKRILFVEGHKDTAEYVKMVLTSAGFETEISFSGKECLKKAEKGFDLILLDTMLPDACGWDIFTKIKERINAKFAFLGAIPVSTERMTELKKSGISDYITKPFEKEDLIARIKEALKT